MQETRFHYEIEKSVPRDHHLSSLGKLREGRIFLSIIMDSFSCSLYIGKTRKRFLAEMRHCDVILTGQ